jgi:hypothetical protein
MLHFCLFQVVATQWKSTVRTKAHCVSVTASATFQLLPFMQTAACHNPNCPQKTTTWYSQPLTPGRTKARAGNFPLCMAVLLGGGSFTKIRQIFAHMGLGCVSHTTYFRYQKVRKSIFL